MNNYDSSVEKALASWTPRKPSPRLRRSIFSVSKGEDIRELTFRLNWLAPSAAALLMALFTLGHEPDGFRRWTHDLEASSALSQPGLSTFLASHSLHNSLALNTPSSFESTTPSPSPSTPSSLNTGTNEIRP